MEKYGVEEKSEDETKTATERAKCPKCGKLVEKHGNVTLCPDCGSEPFEYKED